MIPVNDGYPRIILSGTDPDLPNTFVNSWKKYSDRVMLFNGRKAELWKCWDNIMGRTVAFKRLKKQFAHDDIDRRRFLREARVTAQLAHPNTIPVYEIGITEDDSIYFTMKKLVGEDLYEVIKRLSQRDPRTHQIYTINELVEVFMQVSHALAFAHAHGVIHRDVKPENIWLGQFSEVVLLDWGVSKVWGVEDIPMEPEDADKRKLDTDDRTQLRTLTRSGQLPGTPLYMAPEQILGHKSLDERADVFSMGVMFYELMTLKLPFQGVTVRKTFDKIIHDEPIEPRTAAPSRQIPKSIEAIIMKAICKKPSDRYQSMPEMISDIRAAELPPVA